MKRDAVAGLYRVMRIYSVLLTPCLLIASACLGEPDDPAPVEQTGVVASAVTGTALSWHSCGLLSCDVLLSSDAANVTCFISGLTGKFTGGTASDPAGAVVLKHTWIDPNTGKKTYSWDLHVSNPTYQNIGVGTVCITGQTNLRTQTWDSQTNRVDIPTSTSTQRCWLAGFYNYNSSAFSSYGNLIEVTRDGSLHHLGGSIPASGHVRAFATCIDVPESRFEGAFGNATSSQISGPLADRHDVGDACGLTMIGGIFTAPDPNRGVWIGFDGGTNQWNWTFTQNTQAGALCVR